MRFVRITVLLALLAVPSSALAVSVEVRWFVNTTLSNGTPAGAFGVLGEFDVTKGNDVFLIPPSPGLTATGGTIYDRLTVPLTENQGVALVCTSPTTAEFGRIPGTPGWLLYGVRGGATWHSAFAPAWATTPSSPSPGQSREPLITVPIEFELEFPLGPPEPQTPPPEPEEAIPEPSSASLFGLGCALALRGARSRAQRRHDSSRGA